MAAAGAVATADSELEPEDVAAGYYDEIAFRIQQHGTEGFAFLLNELPRVSGDTPRL